MYEKMTDDFLRERMLSRVSDKLDKRPSALIYDTHEATANELAVLYVELEYLLKNSYGDSAAREFLILLCKDRGISPDPATKAVLRGNFVPEGIVAAGQRFNIGDMNYVFTGKKVGDEEGGWEVQCEKAGTDGNKYLGAMIPMDYVAGLETAELTEVLIPGRDEEDTEELRKRYFDSFKEHAFGGNRADYVAKVRGMEGIGGVKVAQRKDYADGSVIDCATGEKSAMELSGSNVLRFELADGTSIIVRPSGTEPKIKVYILTKGADAAERDANVAKYSQWVETLKK